MEAFWQLFWKLFNDFLKKWKLCSRLSGSLIFEVPGVSETLLLVVCFWKRVWEPFQALFLSLLVRFCLHFGVSAEPFGCPSCPKGGNRIRLFSPIGPQRVRSGPQEAPKGFQVTQMGSKKPARVPKVYPKIDKNSVTMGSKQVEPGARPRQRFTRKRCRVGLKTCGRKTMCVCVCGVRACVRACVRVCVCGCASQCPKGAFL